MGLDTTHGAWNGPYSSFNRFRVRVALESKFFPPLDLMEGFYREEQTALAGACDTKSLLIKAGLPIRWSSLGHNSLVWLLDHSDCDGEIEWNKCGDIADYLEVILDEIKEREAPTGTHRTMDDDTWFLDKLEKMIAGMREAFEAEENVEFH